MIFKLFLIFILPSIVIAQVKSESFYIEIKNSSMNVTSPKKKTKTVSVVVNNETTTKIVARLESKTKVLKRFVVKALSSKSLQIQSNQIETLYFVPLSPPFQKAQLVFGQGFYEIPKKK